MDLIDRGELRMIVYTTERCNGKTALIEAVSTIINSAPTVDAEPVRHGKWKKIRGAINCSACKSSSWSMSFEDLVTSFNYCPNCGAKMDGDKKKTYFPKGFFSKERPLAKGEEDGSD